MDGSCESEHLIDASPQERQTDQEIQIYKRRWWIIAVFSFCSAAQGLIWNTWGPISYSVQIVFGWTDTFTALVPAMADIGLLIFAIPIINMAQNKGLRYVMLICVCLLMLTSSLWLFGAQFEMPWLVYIGGILIGMTSGIFSSAPPLLTVVWFPASEWTTATALGSSSSYLGESFEFLIGPTLSYSRNVTESDVNNHSYLPAGFKHRLKEGILNVMLLNAALSFACFLMVLVYFPKTPPKPPSHSAIVKRTNFRKGFISLLKDKQHWLINLAYNIPNSVYNCWIPLISVSFKSLGISQDTGGWLGCVSLLAGCLASVVISRIIDRVKRRLKLVLYIMTIGQIVGFAFIVCIQQRYIQFESQTTFIVVLYIACVSVGIFVNALAPLYYEFACECGFPVAEGLVSSFLTMNNNIIGLFFYFIFLIPAASLNTKWMTWVCLGSCVVVLPLLCLIKESFNRLSLEAKACDDSSEINS